MRGVYRNGIALLSVVLVCLGATLLVQAALARRPGGLLVGVLFVAAGAGRLYLLRRR